MPSPKSTPSGGGSAPKPQEWRMPVPPAVVVWRNAPGGESCYAIVTKYGRNAVSLMVIPPDSRVGVPKDGVRFIDDPWNKKNGINMDSGVWEYTVETKVLEIVAKAILESPDAVSRFEPGNIAALLSVSSK